MNPVTLPDALYRTAQRFPDHGISHIRPDKTNSFLSFPQLLERASQLLRGLQDRGFREGDLVIVSMDGSSETIPVLWACFLGGIVPALLQPPFSFTEYNQAAEKARHVFRLLNHPKVLLSHGQMTNWLNSGIPSERMTDLASVSLGEDPPVFPELHPDSLAFIQFSSGSTGDPKGVMLTHRNILINVEDIVTGIRLQPDDVSVSWMPLYHDMGLVGFHLTPLVTGVDQSFVEPADFIKNPYLWIDMLSERKATVVGCPNFGQVLINRYLSRRPPHTWDLSPIRVIFNGAEPISIPTMRTFISQLAPFGFRSSAMFPAYGMAEATLAVTFPPCETKPQILAFRRRTLLAHGIAERAGPGDTDVIELVNLGRQLDHCRIRLTDEKGIALPENHIGQVLVQGDNITRGYFNYPEATQQAFRDGWLHTGDLGFLHEGNLFITGRSKDIIFINGINYYSHDLEATAHHVPGISMGKIVMAGFFDETEGRDKVITFLVGADNDATRAQFAQVRQYFLNTLGLSLDLLVPVRSGDIARTSSGKLQRHKMVERFLRNEFPAVIRI